VITFRRTCCNCPRSPIIRGPPTENAMSNDLSYLAKVRSSTSYNAAQVSNAAIFFSVAPRCSQQPHSQAWRTRKRRRPMASKPVRLRAIADSFTLPPRVPTRTGSSCATATCARSRRAARFLSKRDSQTSR
jgi:hypothetical protein